MQIAMIQDEILAFEQLESAYLDRGLYFGDGVYEVLRSYNGKIFAIDEHLERFAHSLAAIDITGVDMALIGARLARAFEAADIANAKIYFHITRGSAIRNHACDDLEPNFFLTITELDDNTQAEAEGISVSTHPDWRWKRCDIKSLNLLANVLARRDAAAKGCTEAILVDENGLITEGAGSAFFAIFDSSPSDAGPILRTAPLTANILPSITRKYVIKAAENIGLEVVEESFTRDQAAAADELFIAVTTKGIIGVVKFDSRVIGNGRIGRYTNLLIEQFRTFTG